MNSDISDLLSRGIELGREGSWEEASGLLRQVVVKDARNVEAWLWLGAMADDPLESVTYLERALEINPRSIRAQKGLDWAREKQAGPAVTETATHQSSTLSSAVDAEPGSAAGNLDWPLPATDAPAIQPEATALQIPPGVSDGQSLDDKEDDKEVAAGWSDEQLSPQESVIPEFGGEKDDSFSGEGRSPLSLDDDDFVSPPARPEATSSGSVELPKAILSAFQFDDEIGSEENPLSASSLDDVAGDFGPTGSNLPTGEQSPPASWDGTANLDEYFSKSPLLDQNASEKGADSFNMLARDGSEPGQEPVNQTSLDVNEAAAPLESWDAIIARLRALDGQIKNEPEDPWTGGDTTGAQAGDLETLPAGIDKLAPSSASANDEQVLADQSGEVAPDTMEAGVKSMPVEPGLDEKISALVEKAKLDTEAGNLTEAIEGLNEALSLDPDRVEANEQFGIVQYQAGNLDAAMSAFETVVRLKPDQAEGRANLGFLFAEKGAT
ncbi:MAG: tetratricopeptide repeat protein, partial [Dehalococcoidia bacterium]|nr:tetratricopeptide repeat protein [Dehalococcoidia bacterium]